MRTRLTIAWAAAMLLTAASIASADTGIGGWLPTLGVQFSPWGSAQAKYVRKFDSFRCGSAAPSSTANPATFDYPMSACAVLMGGTAFSFGSGEPQRGRVVYDSSHRIVLYYSGCCASRAYVLAADASPPPMPLRAADLSGVRTQRGITLGMTIDQVQHVYGPATAYAPSNGPPGVRILTYSSFSSDPVRSS
ncbi:MAG TPA: hypothetical protein VNG31_01690, partial [Candidatus Baltobacteraceae bacterium]|nr:hypothetical protein [Candidatus Baltobacteraceae bacterium]